MSPARSDAVAGYFSTLRASDPAAWSMVFSEDAEGGMTLFFVDGMSGVIDRFTSVFDASEVAAKLSDDAHAQEQS